MALELVLIPDEQPLDGSRNSQVSAPTHCPTGLKRQITQHAIRPQSEGHVESRARISLNGPESWSSGPIISDARSMCSWLKSLIRCRITTSSLLPRKRSQFS